MRDSLRGAIVCGVGVLLVGLVSGCCDSEVTNSRAAPTGAARIADSLTSLIALELQNDNLSDYVRDVLGKALAAGRIDAADYEETHAKYAQCISDAGVDLTYTKRPTGLYMTNVYTLPSGMSGEEFDTINVRCAEDLATIETLYNTQQSNPDLLADQREVARLCLLREGFVTESYTVEDVVADYEGDTFPFDSTDPLANACLAGAGFTVFRA
jgi:hypothetical protein